MQKDLAFKAASSFKSRMPDCKPLRIILHPGPPKTATSALQAWCYMNREVLSENGIRYATVDDPEDPKHQWLVRGLRRKDLARLKEEIASSHAIADHTLILSCEGIMVNHREFGAETWQEFRDVLRGSDTTLFMVRRDPGQWIASLWKQRIINPIPRDGRLNVPPMPIFARDPHVIAMMDLGTIGQILQEKTGASRIRVAQSVASMIDEFRTLLQLPPHVDVQALPRANEALSDTFLAVYQQIARHTDKGKAIRLSFFAVFASIEPVNNVMIATVARNFHGKSPDERFVLLRTLIDIMEQVHLENAADRALAGVVKSTAASWLKEHI